MNYGTHYTDMRYGHCCGAPSTSILLSATSWASGRSLIVCKSIQEWLYYWL